MQIPQVKLSYKRSRKAKVQSLKSSMEVYKAMLPFFEDDMIDHHERFVVMLCTPKLEPLGIYVISEGGITSTVVDIRMLFQAVLLSNATQIILAHNHPSGNLTTSEQDDNLTARIKEICRLIDVRLLDHLIITSAGYFSYADEGRL